MTPTCVPSADLAGHPLALALLAWLRGAQRPAPTAAHPVGVAYSGGVDSTVLLWVASRLWGPQAVRALHVNHGLQAAAANFQKHCSETAQAWGVVCHVAAPTVAIERGDSLEENARLARYAALADLAQATGVSAVWVAQHAHDQAETVLMALLRGSGVAGLAGMPPLWHRAGVCFGRPWLDQPQPVIDAAALAWALPFVQDPSNADTRWTRNRLRHTVWPVLEREFPAAVQTLARSARHCAQAADALQEQAQRDLAWVGTPPRLQALQQLPAARLAQVLRHWLVAQAGRAPSTAQLDELARQVQAATTRGHRIAIRASGGVVRRDGETLWFEPLL